LSDLDATYMAFSLRRRACTHLTASLRHVRGFPRADYYGGSAPSSKTSLDLAACRASLARRFDRGSRVHGRYSRCGRRSALSLAALAPPNSDSDGGVSKADTPSRLIQSTELGLLAPSRASHVQTETSDTDLSFRTFVLADRLWHLW